MDQTIRQRIQRATVSLVNGKGRGSLITGNLILTAAHCVHFECYGGAMALHEDDFIEVIETSDRHKLLVTPYAVEPVADIAIFGPLDDQRAFDEAEQFEAFSESIEPLKINETDFPPHEMFRVHVYTHDGEWICGKAKQGINAHSLACTFDGPIPFGTSGSPVINDAGEIVGVISTGNGAAPRPHRALPVWTFEKIMGRGKSWADINPELAAKIASSGT